MLVAGSLGSTLALWREKTFQALAMTALILVFWLAAWEIVAAGVLFRTCAGLSAQVWAGLFSPWRAILGVTHGPPLDSPPWMGGLVLGFVLISVALAIGLNGASILMLRVWNPTREVPARATVRRARPPRSSWPLTGAARTTSLPSGQIACPAPTPSATCGTTRFYGAKCAPGRTAAKCWSFGRPTAYSLRSPSG